MVFNCFRYLGLIVIATVLSCCTSENPVATIETEFGSIQIELYKDKAPITCENFIDNCNNQVYRGSQFYRVVKESNQPGQEIRIEVIQGGLFHDSLISRFESIPHENTELTGIKHLNGTFSMARLDPGTASTEFFICIGNQPELDYNGKRNPDGQGFSAFGKVISGMDVVRKIHAMNDTNQYLIKPVVIQNVSISEN